jgi:NACHT domain
VNERLEQGLRKAIRVDLALTETAAAVKPMLRVHAIAESGPPEERRTDDDIREVFRKSNGRLLILGEPGTGKTNFLVELAAACITEAEIDETTPIPLMFNLPRWTLGKTQRSLESWIIDDLADPALYGLSRATAQNLARQSRLILFLDGLDEVAESQRAACVEAIHVYQRSHDLARMAICCRLAEYEDLPPLNLRTAVRIEKLTRADVDHYLLLDRMGRVRRMLEGDPQILELIDTPLWLHVAMLAAEVELDTIAESAPAVHRLYTRFITYALRRDVNGASQSTPERDLMNWLGWLASAMKTRNQSQFSLEQLNYSWVSRPRIARLVGGLGVGLSVGLSAGLVGGVGAGLNQVLQSKPSTISRPNLGTLRSQRYAGIIWIIGAGLTGAGLTGLSLWRRENIFRLLIIPLGLALTTVLSLQKGGMFSVHHYTSRFLLWRFGLAPLRYVRFLNEAALRLFLHRRGGAYEFFHLTFRDYMADLYEASKNSRHP